MKTRDELISLLSEALSWLSDYDLRMRGTSDLCDRIEEALMEEPDELYPDL